MRKAAGSPQGRPLAPLSPGAPRELWRHPQFPRGCALQGSDCALASLAQAALQLLWRHLGMRLNRGFASALVILPLSGQAGAADGH